MALDIQDSIFGTLTKYQGGEWEFEYDSVLFDQTLKITIEADENPDSEKPNESIYVAFQWFHDNQKALRKIIEDTIFKHYKSIFEEIHQAWGEEEADLKAPNISTPAEIWNLVCNPEVWLHSEYADLSIIFETTWDPEHGVTLMFKNGEVIRVE